MKKLLGFLCLVVVSMFVGCSSPSPSEDVGDVQEAIGTCPRPTGGGGDTVLPVDSYVSGIGVDPLHSWRMIVNTTLVAYPYTVTQTFVDFGGFTTTHAAARMNGVGWVSHSGSRLADSMFIKSDGNTVYGCSGTVGKTCWVGYTDVAINTPFVIMEFDDAYGSPLHYHVWSGYGLTAILGGGAANPQKLLFYSNTGLSAMELKKVPVAGGQLDACYYP